MLVGWNLRPGEKVDVALIARTSGRTCGGELHLTHVCLASGDSGSLYLHSADGPRLALARLNAAEPFDTIAFQHKVLGDAELARTCAKPQYLEASGAAMDVTGFIDVWLSGARREVAEVQARAQSSKGSMPCDQQGCYMAADLKRKKAASLPKAADATRKKAVSPPKATAQALGTQPAELTHSAPTTKDSESLVEVTAKVKANTLDFLAAASFQGAKPGMVFKRGPQGLGYYQDVIPVPACSGEKRKADAPPKSEPVAKKVALPCGLKYEVLKESNSSQKATRGRQVQVRYDGRLASSGKRFDKGSIKFRLGAGEVIKGWELGVDGMKVGEKRRLLIPPSLGYGARGAPPDIPKNATLTFEVELMKI